MSYTSTGRVTAGEMPPSGLHGITDVLTAAQSVVTDPCLMQVADLVGQLHDLEQTTPVPGAPPPAPVQGIGLCNAVGPLQKYIWVRQRPWVIPVGAVAIVGGLVGIGYLMAGGRRSSAASTSGARPNPSRRRR